MSEPSTFTPFLQSFSRATSYPGSPTLTHRPPGSSYWAWSQVVFAVVDRSWCPKCVSYVASPARTPTGKCVFSSFSSACQSTTVETRHVSSPGTAKFPGLARVAERTRLAHRRPDRTRLDDFGRGRRELVPDRVYVFPQRPRRRIRGAGLGTARAGSRDRRVLPGRARGRGSKPSVVGERHPHVPVRDVVRRDVERIIDRPSRFLDGDGRRAEGWDRWGVNKQHFFVRISLRTWAGGCVLDRQLIGLGIGVCGDGCEFSPAGRPRPRQRSPCRAPRPGESDW